MYVWSCVHCILVQEAVQLKLYPRPASIEHERGKKQKGEGGVGGVQWVSGDLRFEEALFSVVCKS